MYHCAVKGGQFRRTTALGERRGACNTRHLSERKAKVRARRKENEVKENMVRDA